MTTARARQVLRANAVFDFGAALLLLAGTWDWAWDAIDLPQAEPALFVQVGGADLLGFAYLLWWAADRPSLRASVAAASAAADGLAVVIVLAWLVTSSLPGDVNALGTALLIALIATLGAFMALKLRIARAA